MKKFKTKNYNTILIEKQQIYPHYCQKKKKKDKYEYITCEEIVLFNQKRIVEQAKSTYSSQGK